MKWYNEYRQKVENELIDFFQNYRIKNEGSAEKKLWKAIQYAVLGSGKRIRPILGMLCGEISNSKYQITDVTKILLSLELLHASSLVHDDMPCMDNDELRRGKPTVWKKYNEATAILTGNTLNFLAFENIVNNAPPEKIQQLISVMSQYAGINGLNGGQQRDLYFENHDSSLEDLQKTHAKKTGKLILCSAFFGGILGNANTEQMQWIEEYAKNLGMAFQIKDDLLDATGDAKKMGKAIQKDVQKKGYVALLGVDKCEKVLEKYTQDACESAQLLESEKLEELAEFVMKRFY